MELPLAYENGRFECASELSLPVTDIGFVNGATITEQTRTFRGRVFELDFHLDRFWRGLEAIRIAAAFDRDQLLADLHELVERNRTIIDADDDLGLCFFASPGRIQAFDAGMLSYGDDPHPSEPMIRAHTYPLPFSRWSNNYRHGFSLIRSSFQEVPASCWPKSLKCRSRMHYYLADLEAEERLPGAKPILTDAAGNVRDSSIASLIFYSEQSGLVTPGSDETLASVSVDHVRDLARELKIPFAESQVPYESVHSFSEVMLGTTPWCLAPVATIDGVPISNAPGPIFQQLIQAWSDQVGVDIIAQASAFSQREWS